MHLSIFSKVKLGAYAEAARGLGAHLRDIGPWACGGKKLITPGHRARVTAGLPQFTFRESDVTTPCLTSHTYSLLGEQGREGIGKNAQFFTPSGDRTRDLSVVSRARYHYTTESHAGTKNKKFDYEMRGDKLKSVECVRDLDVKLVPNPSFSRQCVDAANKASRMLGFIERNFLLKNTDAILPLYNSLVWTHLESTVQIRSSAMQKALLNKVFSVGHQKLFFICATNPTKKVFPLLTSPSSRHHRIGKIKIVYDRWHCKWATLCKT